MERPKAGTIAWQDLTVEKAPALRDFYSQVVGWRAEEFDGDFNMLAPSGKDPVAGICHARGPNADLPPQWLIYIVVDSLEESIRTAGKLGGSVVHGPRAVGTGRICVIRDPAGAVAALFEPGE